MREALGIKAIERRLELAEAGRNAYVEAPPTEPPNPLMGIIAPLIPVAMKVLEAYGQKLIGGEAEKPPEAVLWTEVERRYDERKRAEMSALADRIVNASGLSIDEPEADKVGKPDGGPVK